MGGYKVQRDEERLLADAQAAQDAGAFAVVVECVAAPLAAAITRQLRIPTIGIGAGAECDGQVLVVHDMLGFTSGYVPRFVKQFADLRNMITGAVEKYRDEVRRGEFPGSDQSFR
jgi:3-methyl-2-oxobutanoate hydroxymethyltransferase